MKKLVNRILLDWDQNIYTDSSINLQVDSLRHMAKGDGVFLKCGAFTYRLKFPYRQIENKLSRPQTMCEINPITGLLHEYKYFIGCHLYFKRKLVCPNVCFITFNQTLSNKKEFSNIEVSNWNFDPIWGYAEIGI